MELSCIYAHSNICDGKVDPAIEHMRGSKYKVPSPLVGCSLALREDLHGSSLDDPCGTLAFLP